MKRHDYIFPKKYEKVYLNSFNSMILKYMRDNVSLNLEVRQKVYLNIMSINKKNTLSKLKSFCIMTGRVRFTITKLKVSRMLIKTFTGYACYSGMYKASW